MWLIKGLAFGLFSSLVLSVVYYLYFMWPPRQNVATGISVITSRTIHQPLWWGVLALVLATSVFTAKLFHIAK